MSEKARQYGKILSVVIILLAVLIIAVWRINRAFTSDDPLDPNAFATGEGNIAPDTLLSDHVNVLSEERSELVERRSANRRVWQVTRELEVHNPETKQRENETVISTVVEVGTGICYRDVQSQWAVTNPQWRETLTGFVMDQAGYTLAMGWTLNTFLEYTVEQETLHLRTATIKAISEDRLETLAWAQGNVQGCIDPDDPRRLVFGGAFGAGIDLVLIAEPDGFHQDVIFHNAPQLPPGMTPDQTHIMVYTELALDNYCLEQDMGVAIGKEGWFLPGVGLNTMPTHEDIAFLKLIPDEDVVYGYDRHRFVASDIYDATTKKTKAKTSAYKQLFRDENNKAYLIETLAGDFFTSAQYPITWDYHTINGTFDPNEIWYAKNTYYVSSDYTISDGYLSIEPGTIVKFADDKKLIAGSDGRIIAKGDPYLPIVFTSKHDNNKGETISGSSGSPARDDWNGLVVGDDSEIEFCRIYYADPGLDIQGILVTPIRHNMFYQCGNGLNIDANAVGEGKSLTLFNNFFTQIDDNGITIHGDDGDILVRNHFMGG
ncbi:MAG: hypothetical protein JW709_08630, partial [Sedimentisphaerales bacterium]|nr:hypothetical protein [Sedimentisphaerales bacterium]